MGKTRHYHKQNGELNIVRLPWGKDAKPTLATIPNSLDALGREVGGWIEVVRGPLMPTMTCGCRVIMLVNEEGKLQNLPINATASCFYPTMLPEIVGNAVLVGEGWVNHKWDGFELDMVSIDPETATGILKGMTTA